MLLKILEGSSSRLGPNKCPFLDAIGYWGSDGAKTPNEATVECRETMKASDIMKSAGLGPFHNSSYFLWVCGDSILRHYEPKKCDLLCHEGTLL